MTATEHQYAAALSQHAEAAVATGEAVGAVRERLDGDPDIVVLFVSGSFCRQVADIVSTAHSLLSPQILIGSTAVGVLGGSQEIEADRGLALWAGRGPRLAEARSLRVVADPTDPGRALGFPRGVAPGSVAVLLADPFSTPLEALIGELDAGGAEVALVGGLASAAGAPGGNTMLIDERRDDDGAVGLLLPPGTAQPVVSQGCRPIGTPWVVTRAEGQLVVELAGRPALDRLTELIEGLEPDDRALAARGLHIGLVAEDRKDHFDQGDFLIRAVLGADRNSGAVAVGDRVEIGQVVQFQVRDEASAHADLERATREIGGGGALVFTCNGRGTHLFSEPDHDASVIHGGVADAVAGMFCAGELGPIAGRNALHGFTATMAVFA